MWLESITTITLDGEAGIVYNALIKTMEEEMNIFLKITLSVVLGLGALAMFITFLFCLIKYTATLLTVISCLVIVGLFIGGAWEVITNWEKK